jgi:hypothetical protein
VAISAASERALDLIYETVSALYVDDHEIPGLGPVTIT